MVFYKIHLFLASTNKDGWEDWRALALVHMFQIMILIESGVWYTVISKNTLLGFAYAKLVLILIAMSLMFFNYYTTLRNNKWKKYAVVFEAYSKRKKIITGWGVFLFLIAVIASLVFAFYQMSLIDWSKYR